MEIYGYRENRDSGEPESEEDVRNWCLETAAFQGASKEEAYRWADAMVEVYRREKEDAEFRKSESARTFGEPASN